jgi:shikimate 5-dehydrogenase
MVEQSEFFADRGWPVWAVRISAEEFTEGFTVLESLGLRAAAVTSPLKIKAFEICTRHTPVAAEIGAVNCIGINGDDIVGHNTDLEGFENLLKAATHQRFQSPAAIIWGGGGTLPIIKKVLPGALELSVRSGKPRDPKGRLPQKTDLLIWAAGPEAAAPPHFEFGMLIDLNYRADSNARELAAGLGKPYVDGMMMFKAQAAGQRRFWSELFNGKPGANSAKR